MLQSDCYTESAAPSEHRIYNEFRKPEAEDPKHAGYSLTEVDLYPAVGGIGKAYSTRRNHNTEHYEIFNYEHQNPYSDESVIFANEEIERMIDYAHILEEDATGSSSFEYGHRKWNNACP